MECALYVLSLVRTAVRLRSPKIDRRRRSRFCFAFALRQVDEESLRAEAIAVAVEFGRVRLVGAGITAVLTQEASLVVISEIALQNFAKQSLAQGWVLDGEHDLDPLVQVARHPIGAAQVHVRLAAILEVKDPAVFQKSSYNTAHANPVAEAFHIGAQGTGAADDEVDFDARSRGPVERLDDWLVQQGIHLGDDSGRPLAPGMVRFAVD